MCVCVCQKTNVFCTYATNILCAAPQRTHETNSLYSKRCVCMCVCVKRKKNGCQISRRQISCKNAHHLARLRCHSIFGIIFLVRQSLNGKPYTCPLMNACFKAINQNIKICRNDKRLRLLVFGV